MDEITETLQRICQKTNEIDDSVTILCPEFKHVVNHFSDAVNLLHKENQRLRKALEAIKELENGKSYNVENDFWKAVGIAREILEESE